MELYRPVKVVTVDEFGVDKQSSLMDLPIKTLRELNEAVVGMIKMKIDEEAKEVIADTKVGDFKQFKNKAGKIIKIKVKRLKQKNVIGIEVDKYGEPLPAGLEWNVTATLLEDFKPEEKPAPPPPRPAPVLAYSPPPVTDLEWFEDDEEPKPEEKPVPKAKPGSDRPASPASGGW